MDVNLPKLGEGADSGVVVSLLVKEGDRINEGQTLIELENEKAVAPIPAPASGTVTKLRVKEGDKISVGQVILSIDAGSTEVKRDTAAQTPTPAKAKPAVVEDEHDDEQEDDAGPQSEAGIAAAPSIRRLARDLGIDLRRVRGSERGGRIVLADLRSYIERLQQLAAQPKSTPQAQAIPAERIDFSKWGPVTTKPLSQLRKVISRHMVENWTTIPHVTQFDEAD